MRFAIWLGFLLTFQASADIAYIDSRNDAFVLYQDQAGTRSRFCGKVAGVPRRDCHTQYAEVPIDYQRFVYSLRSLFQLAPAYNSPEYNLTWVTQRLEDLRQRSAQLPLDEKEFAETRIRDLSKVQDSLLRLQTEILDFLSPEKSVVYEAGINRNFFYLYAATQEEIHFDPIANVVWYDNNKGKKKDKFLENCLWGFKVNSLGWRRDPPNQSMTFKKKDSPFRFVDNPVYQGPTYTDSPPRYYYCERSFTPDKK